MEITVRLAVPGDAPALTELNTHSMGYEYPEALTRWKLERLLADGRNGIFVAEAEGRVVGYVHLVDYDVLYADPMKNVMGIAVDPEFRRQGIGSVLLKAGERWALENGAAGVRLASGESRVGAHAFYRSLGYEGNKMQLNLKKKLKG